MNDSYKIEIVGNTFDVSVYAVFWAAYFLNGFSNYQELAEKNFNRYMETQDASIHVLEFCDQVLNGKIPFITENKKGYLLA